MAAAETLYELLTDDEDGSPCESLPEDACRGAPRAFVSILASYIFTKLGDALASPKTTLAWLSSAIGAPELVLGLLVPIRESGSMVPQIFIGGWVRQRAQRKWVYVSGCLGQAAAVAGIGVTALAFEGWAAGVALVGCIAVFSLARCFCSVAAKDVIGKTIPKPRRGQLSGWAASSAGLLTIAVGAALLGEGLDDRGWLAGLLFASAGLWLLAAGVYSAVPERPGETGDSSGASSLGARLRLLVDDAPFRRFVIARALMMASALSAPYYVSLGRASGSGLGLGGFLIAGGIAGLVSGPIWGRLADRTSRYTMVAASALTSLLGLATFGIAQLEPDLLGSAWFLPLAFFGLSVAHNGARVGRKTYVVNLGTGNQRTDYVTVSNTVIGLLLLLVGSLGALTPWVGVSGVIAILAGLAALAAVMGRGLEPA